MDTSLLRVFQLQLLFQATCALRAAEQTNIALKARDSDGVFFGLQNFLTAAANMSKALWGTTDKAAIALARQPLRNSIGVTDSSPLRSVRMRNNLEHFDERIDEWWKKVPSHNYVDMNLGPASSLRAFSTDKLELFRSLDPTCGLFEFWGESFNVNAVIKEILRILPKLKEEANKGP